VDKEYKQIGEMLIAKGLLTQEQLNDALAEQRITKELLGKILIKRKLVSEDDFFKTLSEQFNLPYIHLKKEAKYIDMSLAMQLSASLILEHQCVPISKKEYIVTVAIANPLDAWALSVVEQELKLLKVKFVLVSNTDMQWLIEQYQSYKGRHLEQLFGEHEGEK
jgi:type IV pilus assembly protein PilB